MLREKWNSTPINVRDAGSYSVAIGFVTTSAGIAVCAVGKIYNISMLWLIIAIARRNWNRFTPINVRDAASSLTASGIGAAAAGIAICAEERTYHINTHLLTIKIARNN